MKEHLFPRMHYLQFLCITMDLSQGSAIFIFDLTKVQ